ncbi:hypothetical protein FJMB80055_47390 [Enterobacter hormaechei]|uniref:Uncharacterized protein n=2 Tax=Enterobacteriaceae TaxID=543 RepID=A0AAD1L9T2_CITBR|nr:hypothetical protein SEN2437_38220 [Salmonella enterica subsp. enterica serovar Virchow]SAH13838.1 Uncharacterised protein [Enterobacter hormaechei]SXA07741.1 Uncharacterised protein [Klebsiella pneumoniae]BCT21406.1 hypothetical protein R2TS_45780 [Enterobacter asburiae]BCU45834.1 hypothetical protein R9P_43900 [Escherichia coli]BDO00142.1 hypothetical protein KAM621c_52460 [Citrobacter braakii]BDO16178.1 hypothetical protein KAM644c_52440 [Klebsiella quasipneumoniae subsp. quasipneumonia
MSFQPDDWLFRHCKSFVRYSVPAFISETFFNNAGYDRVVFSIFRSWHKDFKLCRCIRLKQNGIETRRIKQSAFRINELNPGAFVVRILKLLSKVIAKVNYLTGMLIRDCTDQVKTMRGHTQFPGSGLGIDRPGVK